MGNGFGHLRHTGVAALLAGTILSPQAASAQDKKDPMLFYDRNGLTIRGHLQVGINAVAEDNLFWNIPDTLAPGASYDTSQQWLEGYVKPGVSFNWDMNGRTALYGKVSGVASGTLGIDAFAAGNTGAITLEEGYLGLRTRFDQGLELDVSVGPREFKAGTGMLIANGGSSGAERGALKLGPRKAWESAALATMRLGGFTGTAFYLDANEQPKSDSGTTIVGADLRYDWDKQYFVGGTFGHVLESGAPYPKAAPGGIGVPMVIPGAREGLNFVSLYGRANPFQDRFDGFFVAGDFAYEWNERIDMAAWAGRVQVGYTFQEHSWAPTITYGFQTFSGDDPATARQERFDPLYWEGNPNSWSTGTKSSMVFLNSNVNAHQLSLRITPTPVDTLTLRYTHIRANKLLSPIQFGQGTRVDLTDGVPNPIAGVTSKHLADDVFLEYSRVLSPNLFLTAGVSVSFPGKGIASITAGKTPPWTGAFVNLVANY